MDWLLYIMQLQLVANPFFDQYIYSRFLRIGKNRGVLKGIFYRFKGIRGAEPGPRAWEKEFSQGLTQIEIV